MPALRDMPDHERQRISALCGHVKRHLTQAEPLSGVVLEFALSVIEKTRTCYQGPGKDELLNGIAHKLAAGHPLDEFESHLMIDVFLLHARLGAN